MSKVKARSMKRDKTRLVLNEETVLYYRTRPVRAAKDLLKVKLGWYQRIILKAMWWKPYSLLVLGRGCGKTFIVAVFAVLRSMLYPKTWVGTLGPSMRQGELIFNEIERLYNDSNYFKAAAVGKKVSRSPMRNIVKFHNGSFIEATPLGDGSKIRGARYNTVVLDEFAQFNPAIVDLVINPFLAIKRKGHQSNKLIQSSSAYYKHNHLWDRYKLFRRKIEIEKDPDYFLANFDYRDLLIDPDSPFEPDMKIIQQQKETMSEDDFAMEWLSTFPDESSSYFTSKLIEETCTPRPPHKDPVNIELDSYEVVSGERRQNGYDYVLGVDVAKAEGRANFTVGVGKVIDKNCVQLVNMHALNGASTPDMIKTIRECTINYNVIRIQMDRGGGGEFIKDELAKPWWDTVNEEMHLPILDMDDPETEDILGLRYLRLINFQGSKHSNLFTNLKAEMEHGRVQFPINMRRDPSGNKDLERAGSELISTKKELMVLTKTARGNNLHFSVPTGWQMDRAVSLTLIVDAVKEERPPDWTPRENEEELAVGMWV